MRSLLLSTSFLVLASAAAADTFTLQSTVSAATVYPHGATVLRTIALPEINAGHHTLLISDIPKGIHAESLRIFGGEGLVITSTGFRDTRLPPDDREIAQRKEIETLIEAKQDEIRIKYDAKSSVELVADAANARIAFLQAMSGQQANGASRAIESNTVSTDTLREMLDLVGTETLSALQDAHAARQQMKAIDKEIDALQEELQSLRQKLDAIALPPADRVIVSLDVTADKTISGGLQVSYQVDEANWVPVYELHLDTDSDEIKMDRKAVVRQGTGEPWENVAITLSTARPQMKLSPEDLQAQQAYLYDEIAYPKNTVRSMEGTFNIAAPSPVVEMDLAEAEGATIDMQGLTAVYHLPEPVSIDGDNVQGMFGIDQQILPVELEARATPLLEENVYLFASITNESSSPYLPGTARFYSDGAFIGSNDLFGMVAAGQMADLAFGTIDGLTTERITLRRESGETGILTSSNEKIEEYELRVKNTTQQSWNIALFDRAPYSEEEDLEIEVTANPKPDKQNVDGKRGVVAWHFPLAAGAEKTVAFTIKYAWPEGKELEY